ncbi:MAG: hypothetical protein HY098_00765 [Nitrospinae bacterium]|nr:hypothetical protein [Nitrospinota bacterium]
MGKKKLIKIELGNSRFQKTELKDHASEFILYSRYSGYVLEGFNEQLREAKLLPTKSEFMETFKLELETTIENARIIHQLTKLYPSFGNWKIRAVTKGVDVTALPSFPSKPKKKARAKPAKPKRAAKPKKAAKKPAKKKSKKAKAKPKPKAKKKKK